MGTCISSKNIVSENSLIIQKNEIVSLRSHEIHEFDNLIIHKNGILQINPDDIATKPSNLLLNIKQNCTLYNGAKIQVNAAGYIGGKMALLTKNVQVHHSFGQKNTPLHHYYENVSGISSHKCGFQGISFEGKSMSNRDNNFGGGGGGGYYKAKLLPRSGCGGGGGFSYKGKDGQDTIEADNKDNYSGLGGDKYGESNLNILYYGSGGGGNMYENGHRGGGVLLLCVNGTLTLHKNAEITANGSGDKWKHSGGGSGGSVKIYCNYLVMKQMSKIFAKGGEGYQSFQYGGAERYGGGGAGSDGYLVIYITDRDNWMDFRDNCFQKDIGHCFPLAEFKRGGFHIDFGLMAKLIYENGDKFWLAFLEWICVNHGLSVEVIDIVAMYYGKIE
eukprot:316273_1